MSGLYREMKSSRFPSVFNVPFWYLVNVTAWKTPKMGKTYYSFSDIILWHDVVIFKSVTSVWLILRLTRTTLVPALLRASTASACVTLTTLSSFTFTITSFILKRVKQQECNKYKLFKKACHLSVLDWSGLLQKKHAKLSMQRVVAG